MDKPIGFPSIYSSPKAQKSLNGLIWLLLCKRNVNWERENNGLFLTKKREIETLLFEFDVDLTKIDTKSCFLKTIFSEYFKNPSAND
jgi:hypothetical protein